MTSYSSGASNCSVFWDIENVSVPKSMKPREFTECIRSTVLKPNGLIAEEFYCVCDIVKITNKGSNEFSDGLNLAGVTTIHISSISKNAADEKIIDLMCKYVDKGGQSIVLIAGDVNYVNHLYRFQAKGVRTYLVCPSFRSASRDLINCAYKSYILDKAGNGVKLKPFAALDSNALRTPIRQGPGYVKVIGFPPRLEKKPLIQFKQILNACGGRILCDINAGSVWVSFKCVDDATRAATRLDGLKFGDRNLLSAKFFENPPQPGDLHHRSPAAGQGPFNAYSGQSSFAKPFSTIEDPFRRAQSSVGNPTATVNAKHRDVHVDVLFENFDRLVMKAFIIEVLPPYKGSMVRSESTHFTVKFDSEHFAKQFIDEINSLSKRSNKARVEAKIVPNSSGSHPKTGDTVSTPSCRNKENPVDDDVVYIGTKEAGRKSLIPAGEENKLYLSLMYTVQPPAKYIDQLEKLGIYLLHEGENCMWFRVRSKEKGQKVMEKFNTCGYTSILTERLPDDVTSKLSAVKAWRLRSCKDSKFQTEEKASPASPKVATESDFSLLAVHGLPNKLNSSAVWSILQSFVCPHKGELVDFFAGTAYLKFPSTILMQKAFINLKGILLDGVELIPDIVIRYPRKVKTKDCQA